MDLIAAEADMNKNNKNKKNNQKKKKTEVVCMSNNLTFYRWVNV